jgi:hypothetical protein
MFSWNVFSLLMVKGFKIEQCRDDACERRA